MIDPFPNSSGLRAVIVDDEPPARKLLKALLKEHPQVEVVGEAGDVLAAADLCAQLQPDLVFLDIQLPRADGFALLPLLKGSPAVIFVTAFDRHAVRAFEVNALDYLLKPVAPARLALALSRVSTAPAAAAEALLESDLVALREDSRLRMVAVASITHIEAEDNYTRVYLENDRPAIVRRTLLEWEKLLAAGTFLRVDRSLMVRLGAVRGFNAKSRDLAELTLVGWPKAIALGRKAAVRLRRAMDSGAG